MTSHSPTTASAVQPATPERAQLRAETLALPDVPRSLSMDTSGEDKRRAEQYNIPPKSENGVK